MSEQPRRRKPVFRRVPHRPRREDKPAINPIKKRIRDLNRLLEHKDTLPADVRLNYERELASCQHDVEMATRAVNRSRMIQKYHMVRFFERKKATKQLKRARAALAQAGSPEEQERCQKEVHAYQVDLNYALYYPLHMVYTSLYADGKRLDAGDAVERQNDMWTVVERAMAAGKLQDLRDGKLEGYRDDAPAQSRVSATRSKASKRKPQDGGPAGNEDDAQDEDGTSFFE